MMCCTVVCAVASQREGDFLVECEYSVNGDLKLTMGVNKRVRPVMDGDTLEVYRRL